MAGSRKENTVREKVLSTARDLFVSQGYQKTTIRQIVKVSGITSGSIYYIFKNKEEVFEALFDELTEKCLAAVEERVDGDALAKYIVLWAAEMNTAAKNPVLREIYLQAYTLGASFERSVEKNLEIQKRIGFEAADEGEAKVKTALLKSAVRGYMASLSFSGEIEIGLYKAEIIKMAMRFFGAPLEEQRKIRRLIDEMGSKWDEIADYVLNREKLAHASEEAVE